MKTLLWFLSAVLSLQCVTSQISMVESGPGIVKPTETLDMTCKVTGASLTDSTNMHCVHWVRQPEGKGLDWLGTICYENSKYYGPSVQGRLTLSRDTNKGEVYFKLTGVKPEESGKYYCARRYGGNYGNRFDIWGSGTSVIVTSEEKISPQVFPIIAVGRKDSTFTSFACLVYPYFPQPVDVKWSTNSGETLSGVKNFPTPLTGQPPAYYLLSQVTVNNRDWNSKTYQCNVSHYSTIIQKTIPKGCYALPEAPSVHLLQGTCPESNNGEIELTCQVYNLTSQDVTLKWYINEKERRFPKDELELGMSENRLFALHSTVAISQSEWNNGVRVKCHVTDPKTGKSAEDTIKKCSDNFNCLGINVFMVRPSIEDLYVHKTARIACVATNLKDTNEKYSFEWSFPGATNNLNIQTEDPELQENGTYSVSSVLNVSPDVWLNQTEFTCLFRHNGLQTPIITRLRKEKETTMYKPVVVVHSPSDEERAQKESYNIICVVYSFYPNDIYVGWTENDMEVSKDRFVNSEPKLETNGITYFIVSKLTISASDWDAGTSFSCVVGHETIPMNFTRRSIDKNSGKPTVVNVSVAMSDTTLSCY